MLALLRQGVCVETGRIHTCVCISYILSTHKSLTASLLFMAVLCCWLVCLILAADYHQRCCSLFAEGRFCVSVFFVRHPSSIRSVLLCVCPVVLPVWHASKHCLPVVLSCLRTEGAMVAAARAVASPGRISAHHTAPSRHCVAPGMRCLAGRAGLYSSDASFDHRGSETGQGCFQTRPAAAPDMTSHSVTLCVSRMFETCWHQFATCCKGQGCSFVASHTHWCSHSHTWITWATCRGPVVLYGFVGASPWSCTHPFSACLLSTNNKHLLPRQARQRSTVLVAFVLVCQMSYVNVCLRTTRVVAGASCPQAGIMAAFAPLSVLACRVTLDTATPSFASVDRCSCSALQSSSLLGSCAVASQQLVVKARLLGRWTVVAGTLCCALGWDQTPLSACGINQHWLRKPVVVSSPHQASAEPLVCWRRVNCLGA